LLRFEVASERGPEVLLGVMLRLMRENFALRPTIVNIEDEHIVNHVAYLEIHMDHA